MRSWWRTGARINVVVSQCCHSNHCGKHVLRKTPCPTTTRARQDFQQPPKGEREKTSKTPCGHAPTPEQRSHRQDQHINNSQTHAPQKQLDNRPDFYRYPRPHHPGDSRSWSAPHSPPIPTMGEPTRNPARVAQRQQALQLRNQGVEALTGPPVVAAGRCGA